MKPSKQTTNRNVPFKGPSIRYCNAVFNAELVLIKTEKSIHLTLLKGDLLYENTIVTGKIPSNKNF